MRDLTLVFSGSRRSSTRKRERIALVPNLRRAASSTSNLARNIFAWRSLEKACEIVRWMILLHAQKKGMIWTGGRVRERGTSRAMRSKTSMGTLIRGEAHEERKIDREEREGPTHRAVRDGPD